MAGNLFQTLQTLPSNFNCTSITKTPAETSLVSPPSTPPLETGIANSESILDLAVHVLHTETESLSHLTKLYKTSPSARTAFVKSVQCIVRSLSTHGKVIFSGMGKSGKITQKMVATMNSLGLMSCDLHPTEAMHGDIGIIRPNDVLVLVSYSGKTEELVKLLSHVRSQTPVIAMTAYSNKDEECPIIAGRDENGTGDGKDIGIILPTPLLEREEVTFGVPAPTTSTTVTMALGDALALAVADTMHHIEGKRTGDVFHSFHPGGAIGSSKRVLADWAVNVNDMPVLKLNSEYAEGKRRAKVGDCLMLAFRSTANGWVRVGDWGVVPPRRLKAVEDPDLDVKEANIVVEKGQWVVLDGSMKADDAKGVVKKGQVIEVKFEGGGSGFLESDAVI
ncbi:hypothetical protein TWF694_006921 [Orbilia ellipsospora]|uniref:SIS domain-containing protein n=1 Tax=Orbilia ellipsospora TaxID=2528407 RepID=A0AAV9XLM4_9PEZI